MYVTTRGPIAKAYIKGWFWIDVVAILPRFMRVFDSMIGSFSTVLSFLKIARIGRLIKLFRLLKMAKAFKQKQKMQRHI
jgi:hypothetical protein